LPPEAQGEERVLEEAAFYAVKVEVTLVGKPQERQEQRRSGFFNLGGEHDLLRINRREGGFFSKSAKK